MLDFVRFSLTFLPVIVPKANPNAAPIFPPIAPIAVNIP